MNIRFSDQHIRFRVSQSELDQLLTGRRLVLAVPMPRAHQINANVSVTQMGDWQLDSDPTGLWLSIPRDALTQFASNLPSKEGIEHEFDLGQGKNLSVGFEVDLKVNRRAA